MMGNEKDLGMSGYQLGEFTIVGANGIPAYVDKLGRVMTGEFCPCDYIWEYNEKTTTTDNEDQTVVEYEVSEGKEFYLLAYRACKMTKKPIDANPFRFVVYDPDTETTTKKDGAYCSDGDEFEFGISGGVNIATAGQKVRITVTPTAHQSTTWAAVIVGYERDPVE